MNNYLTELGELSCDFIAVNESFNIVVLAFISRVCVVSTTTTPWFFVPVLISDVMKSHSSDRLLRYGADHFHFGFVKLIVGDH